MTRALSTEPGALSTAETGRVPIGLSVRGGELHSSPASTQIDNLIHESFARHSTTHLNTTHRCPLATSTRPGCQAPEPCPYVREHHCAIAICCRRAAYHRLASNSLCRLDASTCALVFLFGLLRYPSSAPGRMLHHLRYITKVV